MCVYCVCVCMLCLYLCVCVSVASASSARKGFGSAPSGNLDPSLNRFTLPNPTGHAGCPFPPSPLPAAAPTAIGCSFINRKRSLQLALNDFWLNTHALPSGSASVAVPPRCQSAAVRHIIRTKLSYIMQSLQNVAAALVLGAVDVAAYLFLIIFVKAGEIFGIYESAA